jgi:hypothetical protein
MRYWVVVGQNLPFLEQGAASGSRRRFSG